MYGDKCHRTATSGSELLTVYFRLCVVFLCILCLILFTCLPVCTDIWWLMSKTYCEGGSFCKGIKYLVTKCSARMCSHILAPHFCPQTAWWQKSRARLYTRTPASHFCPQKCLVTKALSKIVLAHSCSPFLFPSRFGDRSAEQECVRTFLLPIIVPKMFGDESAEQECVGAVAIALPPCVVCLYVVD